MTAVSGWNPCRLIAAGLILMALHGCGLLLPAATPTAVYTLDSARSSSTGPGMAAGPTLTISLPHASSGFDSSHIIYVRQAHRLEYFAHSEWVDPPARMLEPLLVAALENTGAFRAVVLTPRAVTGDLRLDTEIVRLQHEFASLPSRVRFTLRASLVDFKTRRVLARREFEAVVPAIREDPYGGVVAANDAVRTVLDQLAAFCADMARQK